MLKCSLRLREAASGAASLEASAHRTCRFLYDELLQPSSEIVKEMSGKRHGVFHVENALGSPYIPAQQEFVVRYGIRSVLGFGGLLFNGELFAVILFSTVRVPSSAADRFRTLALDVKSAFSRFDEASVFNQTLLSTVGAART
jgi:hypothetical protein